MTDTAAEFEKLKALHVGAVLLSEGGNPVVYLPDFSFRAVGKDEKMDLLLHPSFHSGYATRLFFQRRTAKEGNWNTHQVADREWWALSWKDVPASLPWTNILCAHLRAVT
jgi:hypothetical protein